jgi:hypothetical protein
MIQQKIQIKDLILIKRSKKKELSMIEFLKGLIININLKYPYTLKEKTKKV